MPRWMLALPAVLLLLAQPIQAAEPADPAALAMRYVAASQAVMAPDAGPAQIAALLDFYADDYVYYHPQFGAKVSGKAAVRDGMQAQIGRTVQVWLEVRGVTVSGELVSVALVEHFRVVADGTIVSRPRIMVLTIHDGRIVQRVDV